MKHERYSGTPREEHILFYLSLLLLVVFFGGILLTSGVIR